jgi:hypothetical protein
LSLSAAAVCRELRTYAVTEHVYEVRYHDTTPLTGSPPAAAPRGQ